MRVGISAEFLGTRTCGIGTMTRLLLAGLAQIDGENEFRPYLASPKGLDLVAQAPHVVPRLVRPYSAWVRVPLTLPAELTLHPVDLFHAASGWAPPWCPCPTVVTVHDLSWEVMPETYTRLMRLRLRALVRRSAHRAVLVTTPSQHSADDLVRIYGTPPAKIRVVHNALDPAFAPVEDADHLASVRQRYSLPQEYLLYLGVIEPKKNVQVLLRAYARLRQRRSLPPLVVAGRPGWLSEPILELGRSLDLGDDLRFPGEIAQEDLPALYSGALAFAFLSAGEGFGYPPLEAMACGVPVLAADAASLPEVLGQGALLVDPTDLDAVVEGLDALLTDGGLWRRLRQHGLERARHFQPEVAARRFVDVYAECLTRQERGAAGRSRRGRGIA